jgi:NAD(P)-dependent dehydrogenase (short-subunit alcohol dehydrogenase family)
MENVSNKTMELFGLSGKVAIVTGAAGQLGGCYVRTLLEAGAFVAALDVHLESPKSKLKNITSDRLLSIEVDINDKGSLEKGIDTILSRFGGLNILINNAAIDTPPNSDEQDTGPFETYPESSWQIMMDVNLKGTFFACQVIGGHMAKSGGGNIINISSLYGVLSPDQRIYEYKEKPFFKPAAYSVSKAGVLGLTKYLATYWANHNVRVNALVLGGVFNNQDEAFIDNYITKVPLGRMAREDEYNGAILFLASDASSYMTGANIVIDGGFSCW